ncbi:hypothetical protein [Streptacidiphilus anmyonensis]|uniref:hypothetical protein n=1 Tax=Streptacidiphilus anmyonensis TaxID=405782 RepID=UPI0005A67AE3|nr:hypothetical protein [Streptacidiphilus anmyonensis]
MPTRYPTALPDVPESRWNAEHTEPATIADDATYAEAVYEIDAESGEQAETRTLAWIDHEYEDDLRGATTTALHEVRPGRWCVRLRVVGEF